MDLQSTTMKLKERISQTDVRGRELSTIALKGDTKLVETFFSENVTVKGTKGTTQLFVAAFWGFNEVVKTLVDNGADVNAPTTGNLWTPLHAAAFQEHGKVVMCLLEAGANPDCQDSEGRTPADFASASVKIWPHFAAVGCQATSKSKLMEMGIIRKVKKNFRPVTGGQPSTTTHWSRFTRPNSAYVIERIAFQGPIPGLGGGDVLREVGAVHSVVHPSDSIQ